MIDKTKKQINSLKTILQSSSAPDYQNDMKFFNHLDKLSEWKEGGNPFPIMVDMDLTNACNHMCPGCVGSKNVENEFLPFLETDDKKDNTKVPYDLAVDRIYQFAKAGVESVIFGGGGDPTMHPQLAELIRSVKSNGMEIAVNTNGMRMSDKVVEAMVDYCTWTRISIDADGPVMYKKTHGINERGWNKTIENIDRLVKRKKEKKSKLVVGLTYLLGPDTIEGVYHAAELAKDLDVNYIRFRPFFNWAGQKKWTKKETDNCLSELEKCNELCTDSFQVSYTIDRLEAMALDPKERRHKKCYTHHFLTSISSYGTMAPCCLMKNNPKYELGNLNKNTFKEIWESQGRIDSYENIDFVDCPNPCMFEENNEFLWDIKQAKPHSNFL